MKKWLFLLLAIGTLISCQPEVDDTKITLTLPEKQPKDLGGLKSLLSEAQKSQQQINKLISELELKIEEKDTTVVKKISVTAIKSFKQDFKSYAEVQGSVRSETSTMASSESGGRLIQMAWEEGQYIKSGDLVARLDLEAVDKQVAELEKRLELATTVYQRQKRLWDQNIGSEIQFLQAKNNMESLQKSIDAVKFQKTKAEVYSPVSGVIDRVLIQQGEMAGPGSPILMIMNTSKVKVIAGVPEKYLKNVKRGDRVTILFPSINEEKKARVSQIGRTVNAANRTFEVEVSMSNPGGILKPNLLAMMMINDETIKDAVMIPEELVRQDLGGNDYVYIVDENEEGEVVKKIIIETGASEEGLVVVSSGLEGEELIIAKGGRGLSAGQLIEVEIVEPKPEENNG